MYSNLSKLELFEKFYMAEAIDKYADGDYKASLPVWFAEHIVDLCNTPKSVAYSLEEFAGRFGLTRESALYEIRRNKLFGCGVWWLSPPGYQEIFWVPICEADRYAAILEAEKLATTPPVKHPCLDPELEFHSKRLALALEAWEYAVSQKSIKKNFMQRIEAYLKKHNVSDSDTARIKEICNPWPRGPKSSNKL